MFYIYNLEDKKWYLMSNLNIPRKKNHHYVFIIIQYCMFLRGEADNNALDTIEFIDINKNKSWKILKPIDYGYIYYPSKKFISFNC